LQGVSLDVRKEGDVNFPNMYDSTDYEGEHIMSSVLLDQQDTFYSVLFALETNFNLEGEGL